MPHSSGQTSSFILKGDLSVPYLDSSFFYAPGFELYKSFQQGYLSTFKMLASHRTYCDDAGHAMQTLLTVFLQATHQKQCVMAMFSDIYTYLEYN